VVHKTYTKSSTYVKYGIKFADITNPMPILSLCGPTQNSNCWLWIYDYLYN